MPSAIDSDRFDPSQHQTPLEMWTQVSDQGKQIMVDLQKHDPAANTLIVAMQTELAKYMAKYPNDAHVPDAKMMSAQVNGLAVNLQLPGAPTQDAVTAQFNAIAVDPTMPAQLRAEATLMTIVAAIQDTKKNNSAAAWDTLDVKISGFEKDFGTISFGGNSSAAAMLREEQVKMVEQSGDRERLKALLAKLAEDPHPEIADMARREIAHPASTPIPQNTPGQ
jgi:hypothetical protein